MGGLLYRNPSPKQEKHYGPFQLIVIMLWHGMGLPQIVLKYRDKIIYRSKIYPFHKSIPIDDRIGYDLDTGSSRYYAIILLIGIDRYSSIIVCLCLCVALACPLHGFDPSFQLMVERVLIVAT